MVHVGVHEALISEGINAVADKNRHHGKKRQQEGKETDLFFIKKEILRGLVKKQVILQGLIIIKQIFLLGCSGKGSVGQRYMVG